MKSGGKSFDFIHQKPQKHFSRADDYNCRELILYFIANLKKSFVIKGRQDEFECFTDK